MKYINKILRKFGLVLMREVEFKDQKIKSLSHDLRKVCVDPYSPESQSIIARELIYHQLDKSFMWGAFSKNLNKEMGEDDFGPNGLYVQMSMSTMPSIIVDDGS